MSTRSKRKAIPQPPNAATKQRIEKKPYDPETEVLTLDEKAVIAKKLADDHCCAVCREIYWNKPMCHSHCGNVFCSSCLAAIIVSPCDFEAKCPICREPLKGLTFGAPLIVRDLLDKLEVRCLHCQQNMPKNLFNTHVTLQCLQECKNKCDSCTGSFTMFCGSIELDKHYLACPLEPRKCVANCKFVGVAAEMEKHSCKYKEIVELQKKVRLLTDELLAEETVIKVSQPPSDWRPAVGDLVEYFDDDLLWRRVTITGRDSNRFSYRLSPSAVGNCPLQALAKLGTNTTQTGNNKWRVGDEVEARIDGEWQQVVVKRRADERDSWRLSILDGDNSLNLDASMIRPIIPGPRALEVDLTHPNAPFRLTNDDLEDGKIVDGYDHQRWFLGKILCYDPDQRRYKVHWLGFSTDSDSWVYRTYLLTAGQKTKMRNKIEQTSFYSMLPADQVY